MYERWYVCFIQPFLSLRRYASYYPLQYFEITDGPSGFPYNFSDVFGPMS